MLLGVHILSRIKSTTQNNLDRLFAFILIGMATAGVAQLVEPQIVVLVVTGSIPVTRPISKWRCYIILPLYNSTFIIYLVEKYVINAELYHNAFCCSFSLPCYFSTLQ